MTDNGAMKRAGAMIAVAALLTAAACLTPNRAHEMNRPTLTALTYTEGVQADSADASFTLARSTLDEVIAKQISFPEAVAAGKIKVAGNPLRLAELMGLMDEFPRMFEIVEPKRMAVT